MKSEASIPRLVCSGVSAYLTFVRCFKILPIDSGNILDLFQNMPALKMEDSAIALRCHQCHQWYLWWCSSCQTSPMMNFVPCVPAARPDNDEFWTPDRSLSKGSRNFQVNLHLFFCVQSPSYHKECEEAVRTCSMKKQLNVKYYLNFNKNYKEAKYDSRRLRYGRWELCLRCVRPNVDIVDTVLPWDNIQMEIHSVARFSLSIRKYGRCQISFIEAMLVVKRDAAQGWVCTL